jgi:hypothetical protein
MRVQTTQVFKSKLHHRRTTPSVVHWPAGSDLTSSPPLVGEAAAEASPILGGTTVHCLDMYAYYDAK